MLCNENVLRLTKNVRNLDFAVFDLKFILIVLVVARQYFVCAGVPESVHRQTAVL